MLTPLAFLLPLGAPAISAFGSDAAASPLSPVRAELIGPLDGTRVDEGTPVLARVIEAWKGEGCNLRPGAILEGIVVHVTRRSKSEKTSALQIAFPKADCNDHPSTKYQFTLIALIGPSPFVASGDSYSGQGAPLADASAGIGTGASVALNQSNPTADRSTPTPIVSGQVTNVGAVKLAAGAGIGGATVISASRRDVRMKPRTLLILVPVAGPSEASATAQVSGAVSPVEVSSASAQAIVSPDTSGPESSEKDEKEICSGECHSLTVSALRTPGTSAVAAMLPISQLGYAPRDAQRAARLTHDTAILYLDAHHLLCTFDTHRLRLRSEDDGDSIRSIHAVLIDPLTHSIDRVTEWRVRGNDSYLWPLGQGQVLVHMGHELRLFDAELKPIKSIPVDGPVAWVVASPSTDHVAVGVIKERHSEAVHSKLRELDLDAEEDIQVRIYDQNLDLLTTVVRSTETIPPVLSDRGELRAKYMGHGHWSVIEYGWDRKERTVATFKTTCGPLISAPDRGLIFITGCMASGGTWYRIFRADGRLLLKGESSSDEIAQSAEPAFGGSFAVRILKAAGPMIVDQPFNRLDVTREEIGVYRSSDGSSLSSVVTDDFILAQYSYALSPAGDEMAVVGKDSILFYALKPKQR